MGEDVIDRSMRNNLGKNGKNEVKKMAARCRNKTVKKLGNQKELIIWLKKENTLIENMKNELGRAQN